MRVKVDELIQDEILYPRSAVDYVTVERYRDCMEDGDEFPPILVGKIGGKRYLVDGWHRVAACQRLGIESIGASVKRYDSKKKMFLDAVRANSRHGKPLSPFERIKIAQKLLEEGYRFRDISRVVKFSQDRLKNLVGERVVDSVTGEIKVLKGTTKHMNRKRVPDDIEESQKGFCTRDRYQLLSSTLTFLEEGFVDMGDEKMMRILKRIRQRIDEILAPTPSPQHEQHDRKL